MRKQFHFVVDLQPLTGDNSKNWPLFVFAVGNDFILFILAKMVKSLFKYFLL